jgi:hypothetical protein
MHHPLAIEPSQPRNRLIDCCSIVSLFPTESFKRASVPHLATAALLIGSQIPFGAADGHLGPK